MSALNLLDEFDRTHGEVGFIATYEFDPAFFENRMLAKRGFGAAGRLVVFMDAGRYRKLLRDGLHVSGFNRRYLVVPIDRSPGVFHPKLYLAVGEKRTDGLVMSANCTNAGIAHNVEVCNRFSLDETSTPSEAKDAKFVLRQTYDAFKTFTSDAGVLKDMIQNEFLGPAEELCTWFNAKVLIPPGSVELVHTHDQSLWPFVKGKLAGEKIRRITVIAPFYDRDLAFLDRLKTEWPNASLEVVAQPGYATLDGNLLATLFGAGRHDLLAAKPKPGRRLHAKAFAFRTDKGSFWLAGSPNPTLAAFDGLNTEAGAWFFSARASEDFIAAGDMECAKIRPNEFVRGAEDEPKNLVGPGGGLGLRSAVLTEEGVIECCLETSEVMSGLKLRVRNANEVEPVIDIPIRTGANSSASLTLDEKRSALIRVAAICDVRGVSASGMEVVSNPVGLVQVHQILRERTVNVGGRNRLRKVEETGENIVEYVDGLSSVSEAVQFFTGSNIRFFDGEEHPGARRSEAWKPRNPFKPDTPPDWVTVPLEGTNDALKTAIIGYVERHQRQKLMKHARNGNINGLPNFLDIFRTLNGLLFTYNKRFMSPKLPVIPFPFVTKYVMLNLEFLMGNFDEREDAFEGDGFVSTLMENLEGEVETVREKLREHRVPQMIRAAVQAVVVVRAEGLKKPGVLDDWSASRLAWASSWIDEIGLEQPPVEEIREAGLEYEPEQKAA